MVQFHGSSWLLILGLSQFYELCESHFNKHNIIYGNKGKLLHLARKRGQNLNFEMGEKVIRHTLQGQICCFVKNLFIQ